MSVRSLLACIAVAAVMACQSTETATESTTPPVLLTALPRALSLPEQSLISADNQLGFDLLARARQNAADSNVLLSPLSAGMALGMTLNGAAGTTLDSMRLALPLGTASLSDVNAGYRSLLTLLTGLDGTTTFAIANSIWTQSGFPVISAFLDSTRTNFDAEVQTLDLQAPATANVINGWVNQKTSGAIPTIVGKIDPSEVMILINALYFKGTWRQGFDPSQTRNIPFYASDGTTQNVPTMTRSGSFGHAYAGNAELIELPYGNGAFAMTIVLPASGHTMNEVLTGLDTARFAGWVAQIQSTDFILTLPRFQFDYLRELKGDLAALGMRIAFDTSANFSRIATPIPGAPLMLSDVTQKTFVDVDENGTVAAAVTSVGIASTASKDLEVDVNQPFLFVLRERLSGTIFFVGQVNHIP